MKYLIIADIHGSPVILKKVLETKSDVALCGYNRINNKISLKIPTY